MRSVFKRCIAAVLAVTGAQADAAWYEAKSKHFIIYTDERPDELRDYAQKLEKFDQAVRYIRAMNDPALTDAGRVKIFVLPDQGAVASLVGMDIAAGMYLTRADGSFAFVPKTMDVTIVGSSEGIATYHSALTPQAVFFHEYAHHLQLQNATVAVPTWLAEGFAEFFATAEFAKDGSVTIGKFPSYRWWGAHDRNTLPLESMVGETYDRKMSWDQIEALYARGWLLTDYLALSDQRKGQLSRYLTAIEKGTPALDAATSAFGDLKQLQRDMDAYSKQLTAITIDAKVIPVGQVAIRPLSRGEAAIMGVMIRSKRGVDERSAPVVAADAEKIAAAYPNDPAVQSALAEAEHDARRYGAAEAAADRALAADPKNVHALIYKGRAQVELAKASPKTANWDRVRDWFINANRIDTENAEALSLYYQSFPAAGQLPTQNAADALLYAVELAPQDQQLRMVAVDLLLNENELDEARSLLAPIVYQPHSSPEWHERMSKIMAAISAGDVKAATRLMREPFKPDKLNKH